MKNQRITTVTKPVLPALLSSNQVATLLGINRTSMTQKRKTKGFPEPIVTVDKFPLFLESDIKEWMELNEVKSSAELLNMFKTSKVSE